MKLTKAQSAFAMRVSRAAERGEDVVPYGPEWQVFYRMKRDGLVDYRSGRAFCFVELTPAGRTALNKAGTP